MVNGKKVIAVCVSKSNNEETLTYLREFHTLAAERNYVVIVYHLMSDVYRFSEDSISEPGNLNMINYDFVDALVIIHDHLMSEEMINELVRIAKENDKPRIVVGARCDDAFAIEYQGDDCFESIVRHVIEDHGCRNVYFIAGVPDNELSENWINIYKKVLDDNSIPFDESKIGFGYYWNSPTYEIMKKWLTRPVIPEAVICANDVMAITVCKCLSDHGYSVPENIIVTGFDGIVRERYHYPRLTTGVRNEAMSCDIIMEVLDNAFFGVGFNVMYLKQQFRLRTAQSCGCNFCGIEDINNTVNVLYNRLTEFNNHEEHMFRMVGRLSDVSDKRTMGTVFAEKLLGQGYIAVRDSIWNEDTSDICEKSEISFDETVTLIRSNKAVLTGQKKLFPLDVFLPSMDTLDKQDELIGVYPLRYMNRLFGYYVVLLDGTVENAYCHGRFVNMANISINMVFDRHKLSLANKKMTEMQTRDPLTGLYNNHGFIRQVREKYLDNPGNCSMIILSLDIDRLKSINEAFGHDEGDRALIVIAEIIKSASSVENICARFGTDEFLCAVFTEEDCEYIVYNLCKSIFNSIKNHNALVEKPYSLMVNYDYIVGKPVDEDEVNKLIKDVLESKHQKKVKRANVNINDENNEEELREYGDLCRILEDNLFKYMFQPIVDVSNGTIWGYEALMRSGGKIQLSPLRMISLAKKYNRLEDIEHCTFYNVLKIVDKNPELFHGRKIFINSIISAVFTEDEAKELLEKYKHLVDRMVIEVTEQTAVEQERFISIIGFLNRVGLEVAVDDFGTGYSNSFRIVECLPAYVKIDRSLITGIHSDYKKQKFVSGIIKYAHDNGFKALAEGVENGAELKAVIRMGIDYVQGYYTGRPSYTVVDTIDETIRGEILTYANRQANTMMKRTFVTGPDAVVDINEVAENKYSEVLITGNNVFIKGTKEKYVPVVFRFEDYKNYVVTFQDVSIQLLDNAEIVKISEHSNVTMVFEGENSFIKGGISVPKSSSLRIIGNGSLAIEESGEDRTCIGGCRGESFGNLDISMPGGLKLSLECNSGVAIGGINNEADSIIKIRTTQLFIKAATQKCVGIGSQFGNSFVQMESCKCSFDMRGRQSVAIGSLDENAEISVNKSEIFVFGEGDMFTILGTLAASDGNVEIKNSSVSCKIFCKYINLIGTDGGNAFICLDNCDLDWYCEGASVMCYGTRNYTGGLTMKNCSEKLDIRSNNNEHFSVQEDKLIIIDDNNN